MHFWHSWGSILHKLSKILLSGKSTYGSRETELYSGARRMFRESTMCLQIIHYICATKGEITGMIAPAMVIVSIQVATEFAPEGCDYLVWRASQYFQKKILWSVSRLKDLVSPGAPGFSSHSISPPYYLSEDSSKQTSKFGWKMKLSP